MGGTNEKGLKFLEENKNKPGVITLPSGLQYKVLRKGSGTEHPTANSPCECHYEGEMYHDTVECMLWDSASFLPSTCESDRSIRYGRIDDMC